MLQYLVVLLDDTSVSYCHCDNRRKERKLIGLDTLKSGILFAMKENLTLQFVYPDYELPEEYKEAIESIDHSKIKPASCCEDANVVVSNSWDDFENITFDKSVAYVIRTSKADLFSNIELLKKILPQIARLNVVITDLETFNDEDFKTYKSMLSELSSELKSIYLNGETPQLNILTDRMLLEKMNNCNAGDGNITLAPNGKFYICPAFYYEDENDSVGDLENGLNIKNKQLYKIEYAPICRACDAFQCKRCIWLNRKTTLEVNTPSHEQCVVAHLERNAGRELLMSIQKEATFLPDRKIKKINYLDPFDKVNHWK